MVTKNSKYDEYDLENERRYRYGEIGYSKYHGQKKLINDARKDAEVNNENL